MMPRLARIVETVLYVEDVDRAVDFYHGKLGLELQDRDDRFVAFSVAAGQVLLLFRRGGSTQGIQTRGGYIPGHDASGPQHVAFGISCEEIDAWAEALGDRIESRVAWPGGGSSLFLRDPDGHLVEFVTPGTWKNY